MVSIGIRNPKAMGCGAQAQKLGRY